jgi:hypothetical protein
VTARSATTWQELWTSPIPGKPLIGLEQGDLIIHDNGTDTVALIDHTGAVLWTMTSSVANPQSVAVQGEFFGTRWDDQLGQTRILSIAGKIVYKSASFFLALGGNHQFQNRPYFDCDPRKPPYGSWAHTSSRFITYWFESDPDVNKPKLRWLDASGQPIEAMLEVTAATDLWNMTNQRFGLDVTFLPAASADDAVVKFVRSDTHVGVGAGAVTEPDPPIPFGQPLPPGGLIEKFKIFFNTAQSTTVRKGTTYRKVGLHELGHVLGLGNNEGEPGSSVMNSFGADNTDDHHNRISMVIKSCDANWARQSWIDPWPRPQR